MKIMEGSVVHRDSKFPSSSAVRFRVICLQIRKNMKTEDVSKRGKVQGPVNDQVFPCLSPADYIPISGLCDLKKCWTEAQSHGPDALQPERLPLNSFSFLNPLVL